MTRAVRDCVARLAVESAVAPATRYRVARMNAEFDAVARAIRWHLARHGEWGDGYWMHPAIHDEVDYEKYECARARAYWHWCGDRDEHDTPCFPYGLSRDW